VRLGPDERQERPNLLPVQEALVSQWSDPAPQKLIKHVRA
jgi:hypothetical protein